MPNPKHKIGDYTFNDSWVSFGNALGYTFCFTAGLLLLCILFGWPAWAHDRASLFLGTATAVMCVRYTGLKRGAAGPV